MLDLENRRRRQPKINAFFTPIGDPAVTAPPPTFRVSPLVFASTDVTGSDQSGTRDSASDGLQKETVDFGCRAPLTSGFVDALHGQDVRSANRVHVANDHDGPAVKRPRQDGSGWMHEQSSPALGQSPQLLLPDHRKGSNATLGSQDPSPQENPAVSQLLVYDDKARVREIRLGMTTHAEMLQRERPGEYVGFMERFGPGLESDTESELGELLKSKFSTIKSAQQSDLIDLLKDPMIEQAPSQDIDGKQTVLRGGGVNTTTTSINVATQTSHTPAQQNNQAGQKPTPSPSLNRIGILDPRCQLRPISSDHIPTFRRLLISLLPVPYRPAFFQEITDTSSAYARVAIWNDPGRSSSSSSSSSAPQLPASHDPQLVVGGIKCRLEDVPPDISPDGTRIHRKQLYIQAIGVLAAYREFGIATELLVQVIDEAEEKLGLGRGEGRVGSICAHVWETNDWAIAFYEKRGFRKEEFVAEYYHKLRPRGAWLMRCPLRSSGGIEGVEAGYGEA